MDAALREPGDAALLTKAQGAWGDRGSSESPRPLGDAEVGRTFGVRTCARAGSTRISGPATRRDRTLPSLCAINRPAGLQLPLNRTANGLAQNWELNDAMS